MADETRPEQRHFSLAGEAMDRALPDGEKVRYLLDHAQRELDSVSGMVKLLLERADTVERAHLVNDFCTGMTSAVGRLLMRFEREREGTLSQIREPALHRDLLWRALLPDLFEIEFDA